MRARSPPSRSSASRSRATRVGDGQDLWEQGAVQKVKPAGSCSSGTCRGRRSEGCLASSVAGSPSWP